MLSFWNKKRMLTNGKAGKLKVASHWDDLRHEMRFFDSARCLRSVHEGFADQIVTTDADGNVVESAVPVGTVADEVLRREARMAYGKQTIVKGHRGEMDRFVYSEPMQWQLHGAVFHARDVSDELEQLETFSFLASKNHDVLCALGNCLANIGIRFINKDTAAPQSEGAMSAIWHLFEAMGAVDKTPEGTCLKTDFGRKMVPHIINHLLRLSPFAVAIEKGT